MKNIIKQEDLVVALWNFAKGLQKSTNKTAKSIDKDGFSTEMDMQVIHEALHKIGEIFNLEIQEIQ